MTTIRHKCTSGILYTHIALGVCKYPHFTYGAFTLDIKSVLHKNLGGILDGTQC